MLIVKSRGTYFCLTGLILLVDGSLLTISLDKGSANHNLRTKLAEARSKNI